ncbi:MAG: hypothetical protein WCG06_04560, partial [Candidatus Omnitrophota bacterium]
MRKEVFEDDNLRKHLPWFLTSKIKFFLGLLALFAVPLTLWIGLKSVSLSLLVFVFVMLTALGFVAVSWFERYNHAMMLQT